MRQMRKNVEEVILIKAKEVSRKRKRKGKEGKRL